MCQGVPGRYYEKYAQSRVNPQDHLEVIRVTASVPRPAGRPKDGERVDPNDEDQTHEKQSDSQIFGSMGVSHGSSPSVEVAIFFEHPPRAPQPLRALSYAHRRLSRLMRLEERMNLAHGQRNPILWF